MNAKSKLDSLEQFGWRFGLESIQALLAELHHPETSRKVVHVAGSNGKGSTCAFIASFLKHSGYKTGLYTSPHLCDIRERFRINGEWISNRDFNRHAELVLKGCYAVKKKLGHSPTHFEALTAMAFSWFKEQKVDWVVLEVGLGGRLDATNVIQNPAVSLISPIGLEHQNILGKSIEKIAWEKAGILKEGSWAATIQTHAGALRAIEKTAKEKGAKLLIGGKDFKFNRERRGFRWEGEGFSKSINVPGLVDYQIVNASLALAGIQCLKAQGVPCDSKIVEKSFSTMRWPGRAEVIRQKPLILLDGAHNPDAAKALVSFLKKKHPQNRWIVLNGFLKDKDYHSFTKIMKPITRLSIVTEPPDERGEEGSKVFAEWGKRGVKTLLLKEWKRALELALNKLEKHEPAFSLLITGSLYLGGACRQSLLGLKGLDKI